MSRLHQDELRTVALAEKVQVWQCVSARQLSLDQEFAGREARLFTGVIGYQVCIVYTNSTKPARLVLLLDSLLRTFFVLLTAVSVPVVSSKLRAGSATRSMSQDRMIWDPGSARAPQSPDLCATLASIAHALGRG